MLQLLDVDPLSDYCMHDAAESYAVLASWAMDVFYRYFLTPKMEL
jgi:hypothetical protein